MNDFIFSCLSYLLYGPYSYFFIYFFVKLRIKGSMIIVYILIWTSFSVLIEYFSMSIGLFHYEKGYWLYWSIPIHVFTAGSDHIFSRYSKEKVIMNHTKKT